MLDRLWERVVVWFYVRRGLLYGDYSSYWFMGPMPDGVEKSFRKWERRYIALGYLPIPDDDWEGFGGGRKHLRELAPMLRVGSTS